MSMTRAKVRGAPAAVPGAVVAVTDRRLFALLCCCLLCGQVSAATLPEDRIDLLYHGYDGGGLDVDGPMLLVRKGFQEKVSVWGHYYADIISSASIDVVTSASPYEERRTEYSVGVDYLYGKTLLGVSYFHSEEDDYSGRMVSLGLSQEFFGDLTTLSLGYAFGFDEVRARDNENFAEDIRRHNFRIQLTQVVTPRLLLGLSYEGVNDQGFLNNPYRRVRYLDDTAARGYSYEAEVYPETRNSGAFAVRGRYYLPHRAAVGGEARYYEDSWGLKATDLEVSYTHTFGQQWILEGRYRYYRQNSVDFYSDLFPRASYQNYLARDKDLSRFRSHSAGLGGSYEFRWQAVPAVDRVRVSLYLDLIRFRYGDFGDLRRGAPVGEEPNYGFNARVVRAYLSFFL
jgi:hypothetical protein